MPAGALMSVAQSQDGGFHKSQHFSTRSVKQYSFISKLAVSINTLWVMTLNELLKTIRDKQSERKNFLTVSRVFLPETG